MQAWCERGGPEDGLARGGVEEYRHRTMDTGRGVLPSAAGL